MNTETCKVGVVGSGAFGTCLAMQCARRGHEVLLWTRKQDLVDAINTTHENPVYFKGFTLPENITATTDLAQVIAHGDILLSVIPTPHIEATWSQVKDLVNDSQIIVSATKGITIENLETPDKILKRVLPEKMHSRLAYLSGPSFAAEVAREDPTAVTIASESPEVSVRVQQLLSSPRFRCYSTQDVVGVELSGALKNVLAIACGISDGLGLGSNARAALITRGLDELCRLAVRCGANPLTLAGLAGVGDIVLTCTGDLSRNRTVGMRLGKGEKLSEILGSMTAVAEGVLTSKAAHALAQKMDMDCPVVDIVYRVVHEDFDPGNAVVHLMTLPLRPEIHPMMMGMGTQGEGI